LLAKSKQFAPILLVFLAFPAAALAARGGDGGEAGVAIGPAMPAELAPLQRPVDRFHRLVHSVAQDIRIEEREREQHEREAAARRRRELFAQLPGGVTMATLEVIAACESGSDPTAVSSDGTYRGLYQFDQGTWESVGGQGDPAAASAAEQSYRAALLYSRSGSSPWPVCG
jgi:soluble lytic murein transglycosylase-like protein